jgi:hypothetical protein
MRHKPVVVQRTIKDRVEIYSTLLCNDLITDKRKMLMLLSEQSTSKM